MKLGFSYNLFDGEELLPYAISPIREHVDFISVVVQSISNKGVKFEHKMDWEHLVDKVYHYEPDFDLSPRQNECRKREIGRRISEKHGCTHHASLDVDEFYKPEQIEFARGFEGDVSLALYANYFKSPCWKVIPDNKYLVNFIHKIGLKYTMDADFPYAVDITRKVEGGQDYLVFLRDDVEMQHMTFVRRNIALKIQNSSISDLYTEELIEVHRNYELGETFFLPPSKQPHTTIEVENLFQIPEESWEHHQ